MESNVVYKSIIYKNKLKITDSDSDDSDEDNTEVDNTEVDNTEVDNTDVDNTDVDNTDVDNTEVDNTEVDNTEVDNIIEIDKQNKIIEIQDVINNITQLNASIWSNNELISKIWHELLLNVLCYHCSEALSIQKCIGLTERDRFNFFKTIVNTDFSKTYISFVYNMEHGDRYGVILFQILKTYYETDESKKILYNNELSSLLTYYWISLDSNILINKWYDWSYLINVSKIIFDKTFIWTWSTRMLPWIFILNNLGLFDAMSYKESILDPEYPFKNNKNYYPLHLPFLFRTQLFTEPQIHIIFMRRFHDGTLTITRNKYIKEYKSMGLIKYNNIALHDLFEAYENTKSFSNIFINKWKSIIIYYGMFSIVKNIEDPDTLIEMKQSLTDYWFNALNDDEYLEDIKIIFEKYL